ncbi:DUF547 domain-containing protein [Formosa sp. PL04]|uniref:DUF547 domain-containing protein n=1 Tax=Formosa sp. PL04 TaxID=3081755 RepID=UPI002980D9ED|nr:DUF547 domain-containing protein [Formosa sp. PL04]MDW5287487.1 DUF547 domain-containing protein [Formosa sp. PL04]
MNNLNSLLSLSEALLLNVKLRKDTRLIEHALHTMSITELTSQLITDRKKNTFWINIYNAYFQILAGRDHTQGKRMFLKKEINIAETFFSLDDIEHGILRRYRWKMSLGYLPNLFAATLIRKLAVEKIDYRIHFALNCGAKSCPPIAFYTFEKLNKQLDDALYAFLSSETRVDIDAKTIHTSKILFWFQGDFGSLKGVKQILIHVLELGNRPYKLKFNAYSWEPYLENYA